MSIFQDGFDMEIKMPNKMERLTHTRCTEATSKSRFRHAFWNSRSKSTPHSLCFLKIHLKIHFPKDSSQNPKQLVFDIHRTLDLIAVLYFLAGSRLTSCISYVLYFRIKLCRILSFITINQSKFRIVII